MLFKLLILQQLYNLSDDELEYQTHDRGFFRWFLGLSPDAEVPDAKTIWLFRKRLSEAGLIDELFEQFEQYLQTAGYAAKGGQIIDATLIPVPIQRNSRDENKQIKTGEVPAEWEKSPINGFRRTLMRGGRKRTAKAALLNPGMNLGMGAARSAAPIPKFILQTSNAERQKLLRLQEPYQCRCGLWVDSPAQRN